MTDQWAISTIIEAAGGRHISGVVGGRPHTEDVRFEWQGEPVHLKGHAVGFARRALLDWLSARNAVPTDDACELVTLRHQARWQAAQADRLNHRIDALIADNAQALSGSFSDRAIRVWRFRDAPLALQLLSPHGGDEDWVGWVPPGEEIPAWMESGSAFGCCDVSEHVLEDGATVCIGAHS